MSIDLMFGRPGQTPTEWQKELQQVTDMRLNHVSLYELTMKKLTPMGKSFRAGKIVRRFFALLFAFTYW